MFMNHKYLKHHLHSNSRVFFGKCNNPKMTKKTIALFAPSLRGGGAERVVVTLANELSAKGHCVDLVLSSGRGEFLDDVSPKVCIVDLKAGRVIKSLIPLIRYLRQKKPEVMLSFLSHANVVAIIARFFSGFSTRIIVSEHTTATINNAFTKNISANIIYRLIPFLYRRADAIVAVSVGVARDLEELIGLPCGTVKVIYNPFDLVRINTLSREPIYHPWFANDQPPVILAVGRLGFEKDFSTLIRAFASIRNRLNVRLLILGEGELRSELEGLAVSCGLNNDEINMPGFISNPYVYMAGASLFVLSSRWEGLSNVLIEAMACGVPVISTNCPNGPREILEDGRWGKLVPVGDVNALSEAIFETLTTNPVQFPNVKQRASQFDMSFSIRDYLEVLDVTSNKCRGNS